MHGVIYARPRRLAALAKVKNIPWNGSTRFHTRVRAHHSCERELASVRACTDTLLDLARPRVEVSASTSCPIWSLTPPRGSFLDLGLTCARSLVPISRQSSTISLSTRLR